MYEKWVLDQGEASMEEIPGLISKYLPEKYFFLAGYSDSYHAGREELQRLLSEKQTGCLMELRVFTKEIEIFFFRSMEGEVFHWRVASENGLEETDFIEYRHFIDSNMECSKPEKDGMHLVTTVGGQYSLPILPGQDAVKIRTYISYDENGMAKATDHRVCGFLPEM